MVRRLAREIYSVLKEIRKKEGKELRRRDAILRFQSIARRWRRRDRPWEKSEAEEQGQVLAGCTRGGTEGKLDAPDQTLTGVGRTLGPGVDCVEEKHVVSPSVDRVETGMDDALNPSQSSRPEALTSVPLVAVPLFR